MSDIFPQYAQRSVAQISRNEGGSLLRRWFGCWIDFLVLCASFFLFAILARPIILILGEDTGGSVAALVWFVCALLYFPVMETIWGRTVGKFASGTIVLTADGSLPGFWRSVVRTLFRLIEVNPFLAGGVPAGIFVLLTPDKQRLGDLVAGTYVIPVSRRPMAAGSDAKLAEVF
jgi:uncharacterized RDD family membrane protein YckC